MIGHDSLIGNITMQDQAKADDFVLNQFSVSKSLSGDGLIDDLNTSRIQGSAKR